MINGIDVSKWQGLINWNKVKQSGVQFAMLRCSYGWGKNQIDVKFEQNYANAKKVGMPIGVYHYSYATSVEDAIKEADFCYSIIKGKQFEYPIAYDMEEKRISDTGKSNVSAIAKAFCERMESYGYYVSIYATKSWLNSYFTDEILNKYDVWLAHWVNNTNYDKPYGMWQYTSTGKVDGINTNVDLNNAYKDYPTIIKKAGLNGFNGSAEPFFPPKGYFCTGDKHKNIGKIADFMYAKFPLYTDKKALGDYYGSYIKSAIKEFQHRTGLTEDGCTGPITLAMLKDYGFEE